MSVSSGHQKIDMEAARNTLPFITIIIPVYNEERYIGRCLGAVLEQEYPPHLLEIIVADGMSQDRTREIVETVRQQHPNIHLIDNPKRIVPTGLNRAIACARGEVIVRLDGHCEYPKDYLRRLITLRQRTGADNVGGILIPMGSTYVQRAVASAYYSPVALGGATALAGIRPGTWAEDERIRQVDTVHGGCWQKKRLIQIGGFDEEMVRNQDDELSFRLIKSDGKIFQCLSLGVVYHVRNSFGKLFRQFVQYGYWKVQVIRRHPRQASLRHFVPVTFVATLILLAFLSVGLPIAQQSFAVLVAFYFAVIATASIVQSWRKLVFIPGVAVALICMHIGYGLGFLLGIPQLVFRRSVNWDLFAAPTR